MKTLEQLLGCYEDSTFDGRFSGRFAQFVPDDKLAAFGLCLAEGVEPGTREVKEFTRENVLEQLKEDVAFGFEKALNKRGISAGLMYEVVGQWNKILEEGLEDFSSYAMYGLPLFKATAIKYGFDNPIGGDSGREDKYNG